MVIDFSEKRAVSVVISVDSKNIEIGNRDNKFLRNVRKYIPSATVQWQSMILHQRRVRSRKGRILLATVKCGPSYGPSNSATYVALGHADF